MTRKKSSKPNYTPERIKGLKFGGPPLAPGEVSISTRLRLPEKDAAWLSGLSVFERGQLISWARAQGWEPAAPPPVQELEEPDEDS